MPVVSHHAINGRMVAERMTAQVSLLPDALGSVAATVHACPSGSAHMGNPGWLRYSWVGFAILLLQLAACARPEAPCEDFDISPNGKAFVCGHGLGRRVSLTVGKERSEFETVNSPVLYRDNMLIGTRWLKGSGTQIQLVKPSGEVIPFTYSRSGLGQGDPVVAPDGAGFCFVQWSRIRSTSMGGQRLAGAKLMWTKSFDYDPVALTLEEFRSILISPGSCDRERVFFTAEDQAFSPTAIYSATLNSTGPATRLITLSCPETVAASPATDQIAFTDRREGNYFVKVASKSGKNVRVLKETSAEYLRFSDDGRSLYLLHQELGAAEAVVEKLDVNTGKLISSFSLRS